MNNWKIVGKIAAGFAIIFVVFGVFAGIITYNLATMQPDYYPLSYILISVFSAMLIPYLLIAALMFVVAWFAIHAEADEKTSTLINDDDEQETKPAVEPQLEETKQ